MPFETFQELTKGIERFLARPDLEADIPDFLYIAELEGARDLDLPTREVRKFGEVPAGADSLELPSDYLSMRWIAFNDGRTIRTATPSDRSALVHAAAAGDPLEGFISGGRLVLTPSAAEARYELFYEAGPEHLSANRTPATYLSRVAGDYLLYTALLHAAAYLVKPDIATWQFMQQRARASAGARIWNSRFPGGGLAMHSDTWTP